MSSEERQRLIRLRAADRAKTEAKARKQAAEILACAEWKPHPYLERKGFPQECGMVHESKLVIPMWNFEAYGKILNSAQKIEADGKKKFLFGGKAKGRSEEHTSTPVTNAHLVCRLLLEKTK